MSLEILPDFVSMTMEEMDEWVAAEEAKSPFNSFDLGTAEGRKALLHKYYRIGDTSLFEAVSHVWASLKEPKAAQCTAMGLAAGTGGTGKRALVLVLHEFLAAALETINWIPPVEDYESLDDWHAASMQTFAQVEIDLQALIDIYANFLDGRSADPADETGVVLQGPWAALTNPG